MKKKILVACLCVALAVLTVAGTTLAYLTSKDTVTNTFTVGQVKMTLDEAKVNTDGDPVDKTGKVVTNLAAAERVKENSYKLMPGKEYTKDPTVTIKAGSESAYVRLLVTATFTKTLTDAQLATKLDDIFTGYSSNWVRNAKDVKTVDGKTVITYEYRYNTTVSADTEDNKLPALFTAVVIPEDWTNETLEAIGGVQISIVGQAIQADGFETADAAWAKFPTT